MTLNVNESLLAEVQQAHPGVTKTALVEEGQALAGPTCKSSSQQRRRALGSTPLIAQFAGFITLGLALA